ncbi:small ribosomal subunit protein mS39 [Megachile rotundata]|uniref:small ribosomal subunit protein mS39 n=1 Tax=Megachile rotundata TaxID=143995 RepID=UPI003FCF7150
MNHFKYVSSRGSWCQLKRLQSSVPQIQIPPRIERGPTDILAAIESTVPENGTKFNYLYQDDPFLFPMKKQHYRIYALAYESGKRTAMWIQREHRILFPKHLSEPPIKAFQRPPSLRKCNLSEEILINAISERKVQDAAAMYEALEAKVSNTTKQALLELLLYYNNDRIISKEFPMEQWYNKPQQYMWRHNNMIENIYKFLIKQDPETAALAHNAMLSGLAKYLRKDEAMLLFEKLKKENIPISVASYNYIITAFVEGSSKKVLGNIEAIYDILKTMNTQRVKPNVRTLNAVLKVIARFQPDVAETHMKYILKEFNKLNIKYSLATYYHILNTVGAKDSPSYQYFMDILHEVSKERFVLQDPDDVKFYTHVMYVAAFVFYNPNAADIVHKMLLTGDNYKFLSDNALENTYYTSYMSIKLSTCTLPEFFEFYEKLVPNTYIPTINLYNKIVKELSLQKQTDVTNYVTKIWLDVLEFGYDDISLKLSIISLMDINNLPVDSPLRSVTMDAAWNCWNTIKSNIENNPGEYQPVETAITGSIAMALMSGDRINESIEVLTHTIEQTHLFTPTMTPNQSKKLFETCISKQSSIAALLVIEYSLNCGFPNVVAMAKQLYNLPQLTKAERSRLINLIGEEELNTSDVSKS